MLLPPACAAALDLLPVDIALVAARHPYEEYHATFTSVKRDLVSRFLVLGRAAPALEGRTQETTKVVRRRARGAWHGRALQRYI